jgi:hypothetical protein
MRKTEAQKIPATCPRAHNLTGQGAKIVFYKTIWPLPTATSGVLTRFPQTRPSDVENEAFREFHVHKLIEMSRILECLTDNNLCVNRSD